KTPERRVHRVRGGEQVLGAGGRGGRVAGHHPAVGTDRRAILAADRARRGGGLGVVHHCPPVAPSVSCAECCSADARRSPERAIAPGSPTRSLRISTRIAGMPRSSPCTGIV